MKQHLKNIYIETPVNGNYKEIIERFNVDLFSALLPPANLASVVAFTGSKKGDYVHLKFNLPSSPEWISDIVADGTNQEQAFFIDKGRVIPFGIKKWEHKHIVQRVDDSRSIIIDDIFYAMGNKILSNLMYPFLYLSFAKRKGIYKKYFNSK